jgi:hypothetical protein
MTDKALISELTWRTLDMQREAFPGMPHFIIPDEVQWLLRPTTRKGRPRIHVMSLGVIADSEPKFRRFLEDAKEQRAEIVSKEDGKTFAVNGNCENLVRWWKVARMTGAAKIGAQASAKSKKEITARGIAKIKDRWHLPSDEWPTNALLDEAGISYKTAKTMLPPRPVAQYNWNAKHKRAIRSLELDPKPRDKMEFCGVYVFQIDDDVFKIGSSIHSGNRLKQVSAYHRKRMKVVALFNMEIQKAQALEAEVHHRLRKQLHPDYNGREIFKTSLPTIRRAVKAAKRYLFEVPK